MFALIGVATTCRHHTKIVLGVLKISFGNDAIPRGGCFSCKSKVFFHDLACIATDSRAFAPASLVPRVPASAAIAAPLRSFSVGTLSHSIRVQTDPFLRISFQFVVEVTDNYSHLRAHFLDDWFGGLAFSSQLLVAQHTFAILDPITDCLPRHAYKSSSNTFAFLNLMVSNFSILLCSALAPNRCKPRLLVTWSSRWAVIMLHFAKSGGCDIVAPSIEIKKTAIAITAEPFFVVSPRIRTEQNTIRLQRRVQST